MDTVFNFLMIILISVATITLSIALGGACFVFIKEVILDK